MDENIPQIWLVDSERAPLAECRDAFAAWSEATLVPHGAPLDWSEPPDAVFFSAEIPGGAGGEMFDAMARAAGAVPLLAVAGLRSLAQAVAYFRAGAADYLTLPLEADDARERFEAALQRGMRLAMQGMLVELEPVDQDLDEISLSVRPSTESRPEAEEEDILARIGPEPSAAPDDDDDEPVAVDGLPIPTLWEELPCGLLVFDSAANLVFANSLGLELFGYDSLAALQENLESHREAFAAYGGNHKPFPDNQWPHVAAARARAARAAVVSIEKPDRRRVWLRIDCLPHLTDGAVSRLSMTLVNLTGELPPLRVDEEEASRPVVKKDKAKKRGKKRK